MMGWDLLLAMALPLFIHPKGVVSSIRCGVAGFNLVFGCVKFDKYITASNLGFVFLFGPGPPSLVQRGGLPLGQTSET